MKSHFRQDASQSGVAMTEMVLVMAFFSIISAAMLNSFFRGDGEQLILRDPYRYPKYVHIPIINEQWWVPNPLYGFKSQFDRIDRFFALPIP